MAVFQLIHVKKIDTFSEKLKNNQQPSLNVQEIKPFIG